jgi:hypothetical protein
MKKTTTAMLTAQRADHDERDRQAAVRARGGKLRHARPALALAFELRLAQRVEDEAHAPAWGAAWDSIGVPGVPSAASSTSWVCRPATPSTARRRLRWKFSTSCWSSASK